MPYTASQLATIFTNVKQGLAPTAAQQLLLNAYATQNSAGLLTDAQTLQLVLNQADVDTAVAIQTYQFFTGSAPTQAGMQFLVHSSTNTTDLNDAYYAQFNQENRYINFAVNLGLVGAGSTGFAQAYGSLTFAQAVDVAYETIIGSAYAAQAGINAAAAKADIAGRLAYFKAVAAERSPNMNQDLAAKAAMIGYIMSEGIKADVGAYATATNNFMTQIGNGAATYGVDILATYIPSNPPPTPTFSLAGNVASVSEGGSALFTLTTTNVAAGTQYTYTISGVSAADVAGGVITGTVTIGADGRAVIPVTLVNDATTEGLETLTVTVAGQTAQVNVLDTSLTPDSPPAFQSSSRTVNVAENNATVTTVTATDANGDAITYSISGGADASQFTINPNTGVITFVGAKNFEAPGSAAGTNAYEVEVTATANGRTAVQTLTVNVTNVNEAPGVAAPAMVTLNENQTAVTVASVLDVDASDTHTFTLSGPDAALFQVNAQGVISFIAAPNFEAPADAGADNVYNITVTATDAGGLSSSQSIAITVADVAEAQSFTLTTAANSVTGGSGDDLIQGDGATGLLNTNDVLDGGAGSDTLTAQIAAGAAPRATVNNVETIALTANGAGTATYNALTTEVGGDGLATIRNVQSAAGANLTVTNLAGVANLELQNVGAGNVTTVNFTDAALAAAGQEMAVTVSESGAASVTLTDGGGANALETVTVTVQDAASNVTLNVAAVGTTTVNVSGSQNATLSGGAGLDTVTVVNASGLSGTFVYDASTGGAVAKTIQGSGSAASTITGAGAADVIIGGSAVDVLVGGGGADTIRGGAGADQITGDAGSDVLDGQEGGDTYIYANGEFVAAETISDTGASGVDVVQYTVGAAVLTDADFAAKSGIERVTLLGVETGGDELTLGANAMAAGVAIVDLNDAQDVTVTAGFTSGLTVNDATGNFANVITTGAGADAVVLVDGANVVTSGDGNDTVTLGLGADNVTLGAGADVVIGGANLTDLDTIVGGAGSDQVTMAGDITLTAANLISGVETFTLNSEGDIAGANTGFQYAITVDNDNDVDGLVTTDVLTVNASGLLADADSSQVGNQAETLNFSAAAATLFSVSVTGGAANDTIGGGALADTILGGAGADQITGGAGSDVLDGQEGGDTYIYADGQFVAAETISDTGATGTDTADVTTTANLTDALFANKTGLDALTVNAASTDGLTITIGAAAQAAGVRTVTLDSGDILAAGAYTVGLTVNDAAGAENITTGTGNDSIVLTAGANVVTSGDGDDTVTAGAGADNVTLGVGNDVVIGGANITAADTLTGGAGTDDLRLNAGATAGVNQAFAVAFDGDFTQFEQITLAAGAAAVANAGANDTAGGANDYTLTLGNAANVGAGVVMTVDASALRASVVTNVGADNEIGGGDDTTSDENLALTATAIAGSVSVLGGAASDTVTGSAQADTIFGNAGNDVLNGGGGADQIDGGTGADTITGGDGADSMAGQAGDDVFVVTRTQFQNDADTVTGGDGTDTLSIDIEGANYGVADVGFGVNRYQVEAVSFTGGAGTVTWNMGTFSQNAGVSQVSTADNTIILDVNASSYLTAVTLSGAGGADTLTGGSAADVLNGGAGADSLTGGAGNDSLNGGTGVDNDTLVGGDGDDTITIGGAGDDNVSGGNGNDVVIGAGNVTNADTLAGGAGTDELRLSGDYNLTALAALDGDFTGFESLVVATGTQATAVAGAANDVAGDANVYAITLGDATNVATGVTMVVDASALTAGVITNLGGDGEIGGGDDTTTDETLTLTATAVNGSVDVRGGAGGDTVSGSNQADTITGNAGADSLTGNGGVDVINGGVGNDTIDGGAGADVITAGEGVDVITGGQDADSISLTEATAARDTLVVGNGESARSGVDVVTGFAIDTDAADPALLATADLINFGSALLTSAHVTNGVVTGGGQLATGINSQVSLLNVLQLIENEFRAEGGAQGGTFAFSFGGSTYVAEVTGAAGAETITDVVQLVGVGGATQLINAGGTAFGLSV